VSEHDQETSRPNFGLGLLPTHLGGSRANSSTQVECSHRCVGYAVAVQPAYSNCRNPQQERLPREVRGTAHVGRVARGSCRTPVVDSPRSSKFERCLSSCDVATNDFPTAQACDEDAAEDSDDNALSRRPAVACLAMTTYGRDHGKMLANCAGRGVLAIVLNERNIMMPITVPPIPRLIGTVKLRQRIATQVCTANIRRTVGVNENLRKKITDHGIGRVRTRSGRSISRI
jgi:hypothetical protein